MFEIHSLVSERSREPASGGQTEQMFRTWAEPRNAAVKADTKPTPAKASAPEPQVKRGVFQVEETNFIDQRLKMKRSYVALRGADVGTAGKKVPRTTNADVFQVMQYWTKSVVRFGVARRAEDKAPLRNWREAMSRVHTVVAGKEPNAVYPDNERFWQSDVARVAIWLNSLGAVPSKASLAWSSFVEAVVEAPRVVVDTVTGAGKKVGEAVGKAGEVAGEIVVAPLKGAAGSLGLGKLLIGAGVVVAGVIIVPRLLK